jgi:hypothetical protein
MGELNYEKDVSIDPQALDVEWVGQAALFMRYSEKLARARDAFDRAKELLDVTRAELAMDIRKNPAAYGIEKTTEGALNEVITATLGIGKTSTIRGTQSVYQEANDAYIEIKLQVELLTAVVKAMDQRKAALENLVRLHGQNYFAGPKEPRDLGMEWDKKVQASRDERVLNRAADRVAKRGR